MNYNAYEHWVNMPEFKPDDISSKNCFSELEINFDNVDDKFNFLTDCMSYDGATSNTKSIWFPKKTK